MDEIKAEIILPFVVTYDGRDADHHELEAISLGESVIGAGRLYTAVAHYCAFGFVPKGNYRKELEVRARPASPGSWDQVYAVVPAVAGSYGIYAVFYKSALSFIFKQMIEGVVKWWTKPKEKDEIVKAMLATFQAESLKSADVIQTLADGLVRSNEKLAAAHETLAAAHMKLIDTLPVLAQAHRPSGAKLVQPVGKTCKTIAQFARSDAPTVIDEADADAIRGDAKTEVDPMAQFSVSRISEVNTITGHCILDVEGLGRVSGKITDPVISLPGNVYTSALNNHTAVVVDAKAVRENGAIKRLYVQNAGPKEE